IGVADRSLRIIKSLDRRTGKVGHVGLSPDGRTIAYCRLAEPDSTNRSIFLIDVESVLETRATTQAAEANVLGWTPDSRRLVFMIGRQGTKDAWMLQVADSKPRGAPQLVKTDLGMISPLGITNDGAIYYGLIFGPSNVLAAALDLERGTVVAAPLPGESFSVNSLSVIGWSPDGQHLA